ncbi:MAG: ribonuclease M5 [Mycoplasmataceae bacterium]|nr:ribonuclease M5 [Mycoplasmataceae bacterium]
MKREIKEIVVVEGKTDTEKLKKNFIVETIETNGSRISKKTIELIKKVNLERGVILFLDPDGSGEKVRRILENNLENFKQAFIKKRNKKVKKVGVAEASDDEIINAIENVATFQKNKQSLSWKEYLELNIDSKLKRTIICENYNMSYCNNKQLFKRLNMISKTKNDVKKILF